MTFPRVPWPLPAAARRPRTRRCLLLGTVTVLTPLTAEMVRLEVAMRRAGGAGIIALELAGTSQRLRQLLSDWGVPGQAAARRSLQLDYTYMIGYAFGAALLVTAADERRARATTAPSQLGPLMAWGMIAAAGCDAVEGTALLRAVRNGPANWLPQLARTAALTKFGLLTVGMAYCASAMVVRVPRPPRPKPTADPS